jgi:threonine synthase
MKYVSTRKLAKTVSAGQAILQGLASDGGLYVPESWPPLQAVEKDANLPFAQFAAKILKPFFKGDPLEKHLDEICTKAFDFPLPLKILNSNTAVLELFHGPTNAFKDFGARFLALATEILLQNQSEEKLVLVATSGDTGGAVASAFCLCTKIPVVILFPKGKVSKRQEHQLTCWGEQVRAFAVDGTFDDCQKIAKQAFLSEKWRKKFHLISANSINIGRLLPQMAYFAYASLQFRKLQHQSAGLIIPSGNMGNSVAALWAQKLGYPIEKVIFAHNANRAVFDYFQTGKFQAQETKSTLANAMDVGHPSNFERVTNLFPSLEELKTKAQAFSVSDEQIEACIKLSGENILCPHTAVAAHVRQQFSTGAWIIVAAAHAAKFETIVENLLAKKVSVPPELQKLLQLKTYSKNIKASIEALEKEVW